MKIVQFVLQFRLLSLACSYCAFRRENIPPLKIYYKFLVLTTSIRFILICFIIRVKEFTPNFSLLAFLLGVVKMNNSWQFNAVWGIISPLASKNKFGEKANVRRKSINFRHHLTGR